jgi:hypothetical protein
MSLLNYCDQHLSDFTANTNHGEISYQELSTCFHNTDLQQQFEIKAADVETIVGTYIKMVFQALHTPFEETMHFPVDVVHAKIVELFFPDQNSNPEPQPNPNPEPQPEDDESAKAWRVLDFCDGLETVHQNANRG